MDAINALIGGAQQARAAVDAAAQQIAASDLPTASAPDVTSPAAPKTLNDVDVAEQLTTMMVEADAHHVTTAALRQVLDTYQDTLDLLSRP